MAVYSNSGDEQEWKYSVIEYYAAINMQFIHSVNGDGSKTAKIIKKVILHTVTSPESQSEAE